MMDPTTAEPIVSSLLSTSGAALALGLASFGAASGTANSSKWWSSLSGGTHNNISINKSGFEDIESQQTNKQATLKYLVPVIMSGVIALYGLIMAVIITTSPRSGAGAAAQFAAGLACGLACLASGRSIGRSLPAKGERPATCTYILPLIYAEAIGLYGLIVGLTLNFAVL